MTSTKICRGHADRLRSAAMLISTLALAQLTHAQATKRCDLTVNSTPGAGAEAACLDLVSLTNGGPAIQTASNATRISQDGFKFCKNAFQMQTTAGADVVFIFDNSGSMFAQVAYIDTLTNDTTYYYGSQGCRSRNFLGEFVLNTANGPLTCVKIESNDGCTSYSGDPYEVRAQVIKSAIDYMALTSPISTAGVVGFALTTLHPIAPLQLNVPANVQQVKDSVIIDSIGRTNYGPPIIQANAWFNNPAIIKTQKKAIVFISDGAPNDSYLNSVDRTIPIYSIYLGQVSTRDTANLKELSDLTNGTFTRVNPKKPAEINAVMQTIIQSLLVSTLPRSIQVTNTSFVPPQISRTVNLTRNPDSSISMALDSIIALNKGLNTFNVKIDISDTLARNYSFKIQADGPVAAASTSNLTCFDPPSLVMLNSKGTVDSVYPGGTSNYQIKLSRSDNDLASVTINAVTKDSLNPQPWGDTEIFKLNVAAGAGTNYQGNTSVNGSATTPAPGDAILQSDANGKIILTWVHPRDPREFATYTLPGKKIPIIDPFIAVERVNNVSKGVDINKAVGNPVVIYGGARLVKVNQDSSSITHGACLSNCTGVEVGFADPTKTPSFVFKTASPFTYEASIYDNLGTFVNSAKGSVDAVEWQKMPKQGDSVAVVMSILPISKGGSLLGTGVYILKATIKSLPTSTKDSQGLEKKVMGDSRALINRFGFTRR